MQSPDKKTSYVALPHGVLFNPAYGARTSQVSYAPTLKEDLPNGDYSATWDDFSPPYLHWTIEGHDYWTALRIGKPRLTIGVTVAGTRILNVEFRGFTTFNWEFPMEVSVRLQNKVGGLLKELKFNWSIECLPCYDHETVVPHDFSFPDDLVNFYKAVERVEIFYSADTAHKCDDSPCQPSDTP